MIDLWAIGFFFILGILLGRFLDIHPFRGMAKKFWYWIDTNHKVTYRWERKNVGE